MTHRRTTAYATQPREFISLCAIGTCLISQVLPFVEAGYATFLNEQSVDPWTVDLRIHGFVDMDPWIHGRSFVRTFVRSFVSKSAARE